MNTPDLAARLFQIFFRWPLKISRIGKALNAYAATEEIIYRSQLTQHLRIKHGECELNELPHVKFRRTKNTSPTKTRVSILFPDFTTRSIRAISIRNTAAIILKPTSSERTALLSGLPYASACLRCGDEIVRCRAPRIYCSNCHTLLQKATRFRKERCIIPHCEEVHALTDGNRYVCLPHTRMAQLDGAYDQVNQRLMNIDLRFDALDRKVDLLRSALGTKIDAVDAKNDQRFMCMVGILVTTWLTSIGTTFALYLHH